MDPSFTLFTLSQTILPPPGDLRQKEKKKKEAQQSSEKMPSPITVADTHQSGQEKCLPEADASPSERVHFLDTKPKFLHLKIYASKNYGLAVTT